MMSSVSMGSYISIIITVKLIYAVNCDTYFGGHDHNDYVSLYKDPLKELQKFFEKMTHIEHENIDIDFIKKLALDLIDPEQVLLSAVSTTNISHDCIESIKFITSVHQADIRKLQYFDSFGRPGSGILQGRTHFLGMFDECININIPISAVKDTKMAEDFKTKYCYASIQADGWMGFAVNVGVCSPSQCTNNDLHNILSTIIPKKDSFEVICQDQSRELPAGSIAALCIVLMTILLCLAATFYECVLLMRKSWTYQGFQVTEAETTPLLNGAGKSTEETHTQGHPQTSKLIRVFESFSLYSNSATLLSTAQPAGTIRCIHGIRFLSITWVVMGHTLTMYSNLLIDNPAFAVNTLLVEVASMVFLNAIVSVDTFFVVSALLFSYLTLKYFRRHQPNVKQFLKLIPGFYSHRYIRLTPVCAYVILFVSCLGWYTLDGPMWMNNEYRSADPHCVKNWWWNFIYANNILGQKQSCIQYTWYLACDFQFFLLAPFLVYLFYKSWLWGSVVIVLTVMMSCLSATVVAYQQRSVLPADPAAVKYNFTLLPDDPLPEYTSPWTRYQAYGVGLLAGGIIATLKQRNFKLPTVINLAGWGISAALCLSVVYGTYNISIGKRVEYLLEASIYQGLARTAWSIGVAFVIISCSLEQGGWIDEFLSWKGFIPLSRLSYTVYLIHLPILTILVSSARSGSFYTQQKLTTDLLLMITLSFLISYPFSLLFEQPYARLDKLLLAGGKVKRDKAPTDGSSQNGNGVHRDEMKSGNENNHPIQS